MIGLLPYDCAAIYFGTTIGDMEQFDELTEDAGHFHPPQRSCEELKEYETYINDMEVVKGVQAYMLWDLKWVKELQKVENTHLRSKWKYGFGKLSELEIDRRNEAAEALYERHTRLLHADTEPVRAEFREVIESAFQACVRARREADGK